MIRRLLLLIPTLWRLGFGAVASVALYRLACRLGFYRYLLPIKPFNCQGNFFKFEEISLTTFTQDFHPVLFDRADRLLTGKIDYFSHISLEVGAPPDWFLDPSSGRRNLVTGHWSQLNEFAAGDIKMVWEASRFEWSTLLARAWRASGDARYLDTLNTWLLDWVQRNPANSGPNWKCGQETSIRAINLLLTAHLLACHQQPSVALVELVAIHCGRILPTLGYAVAQNNNHGTSEAAALFICGAWLLARTDSENLQHRARRWRDTGRKWLENRVEKLIGEDGSFAQYSVNYHRVLVDTLCQVEFWRQELGEVAFSPPYLSRCRAAVDWLAVLTDEGTGDAPNMGANDGARLYDLSSLPYRDFRPTVQLASVLFKGLRVFESGPWDEPLQWLGIDIPQPQPAKPAVSVQHADGGDLVLRSAEGYALIRYARFKFRPSHADCLHLDLWHKGHNILRDGGTFSYNTDPAMFDYFSGTASHNTMQFDGRNQMPRLGRFLFGGWLKMAECTGIQREGTCQSWSGAYTDGQGARHRRTVSVDANRWRVIDEIEGTFSEATLRWRLIPGDWDLKHNLCVGEVGKLVMSSTVRPLSITLVNGWESRHYMEKTRLPVLEVVFPSGPAIMTTEIILN